MKHTFKITLVLLLFFLFAQYIGLAIVYGSIDTVQTKAEGVPVFKELAIGERPPLEENTSYLSIITAVLIGTIFLLLLIKLNWIWVWKIWFLLAVILSLTIALGVYVSKEIAFIAALIFGIWKIFKPNFWVHNLTELFVYGGLAVIFVPVLNILSISILLVLIAIYDAYAVWKSKHMITLAKSQTKAKIFAGLFIPYQLKKKKSQDQQKTFHQGSAKTKTSIAAKGIRTAVLGGGDIGFPLIFAGVVLKELGLWQSLIIPLFSLLGLALLLYYGDEKKFYPAMPFIGAGCFLGLGVVYVLQWIF